MTDFRLELTPVAAVIAAEAAPPDDQPAGAGTPTPAAPRTVAGLAVPYEVEAAIGWRLVTFAPGSVAFAEAGPLLLGHDPNEPVGVLVESSDTPAGVRCAYVVDQTPEGDRALTQARSGSRRGLSVGVEVHRYEAADDDPDRIRVLDATAVETSLVSMAAYHSAGVDTVAAGATHPIGGSMSEPEPTQTPADPPAAPAIDTDAIATAVADRLEASARRPRLIVTEADPPALRLGEYCATWLRAHRGDHAAIERLEAQGLTRETTATSAGVIPIAYVQQIVDSLGASRPLHDAFAVAEMPPAGMDIRRPQITARPDDAGSRWVTDETAPSPTGPLTIANMDTPVDQWAFGGAASIALVERAMPSYVEEAFAQMLKAYYRDVEKRLAALLPTAASTVTTIGGGVAAFMAAYRDPPDTIVAGGDAYGKIMDSIGLLRFASGEVDAGGTGTIYGLKLVASPDVAAADLWVTDDDFLESRESSPLRLTVADVGGLSMEIGLTSFFAVTQTRQTAGGVAGAVRVPAYAPAATGEATTRGGKS